MATKTNSEESAEVKRYFIVNPAGALHEVSRERAVEMLKNYPGTRMATKAEISKWDKYTEENAKRKSSKQGSLSFGPVAPAWEPDPDKEIDLDALVEE